MCIAMVYPAGNTILSVVVTNWLSAWLVSDCTVTVDGDTYISIVFKELSREIVSTEDIAGVVSGL